MPICQGRIHLSLSMPPVESHGNTTKPGSDPLPPAACSLSPLEDLQDPEAGGLSAEQAT